MEEKQNKREILKRDNQSNIYDSWYEKRHPQFKTELMNTLKFLDLNKEDMVLDVGCGTGHFSEFIGGDCKELIGLDYSKGSVDIFNKKKIKNSTAYVGDARNIEDYPTQKFDKILSCQVIQHIRQRKLVLENIYNKLKDDGKFVCELQDWTSWFRRWQRLVSKFSIKKEQQTEDFYIYRFSPEEFLELMHNVGFENCKICWRGKGYFIISGVRKR